MKTIHVVDLASAKRSTRYRPRQHTEGDTIRVVVSRLEVFLFEAGENNMREVQYLSAINSRIPFGEVVARGALYFKPPGQAVNGSKLSSKAMKSEIGRQKSLRCRIFSLQRRRFRATGLFRRHEWTSGGLKNASGSIPILECVKIDPRHCTSA